MLHAEFLRNLLDSRFFFSLQGDVTWKQQKGSGLVILELTSTLNQYKLCQIQEIVLKLFVSYFSGDIKMMLAKKFDKNL